jgi:hypothetical protein
MVFSKHYDLWEYFCFSKHRAVFPHGSYVMRIVKRRFLVCEGFDDDGSHARLVDVGVELTLIDLLNWASARRKHDVYHLGNHRRLHLRRNFPFLWEPLVGGNRSTVWKVEASCGGRIPVACAQHFTMWPKLRILKPPQQGRTNILYSPVLYIQ